MILCEKGRVERSFDAKAYNYINYLTFMLYAPLYMTGPILTFNSFISQVCIFLPSFKENQRA